MSTIDILVQSGRLIKADIDLPDGLLANRLIYEMSELARDYADILDQTEDPEFYADKHEEFLIKYISGAPMIKDGGMPDLKPLYPPGVLWEFRTGTTRYIGAFVSKDVFIVAKASLKSLLHVAGYKLFMSRALDRLNSLELTYIDSGQYHDVVSDKAHKI